MKFEKLRNFELNNDVLNDFDALMSMHLDEVEELKINGVDIKSKLLNIISLCINIKTIIIEGDQRVNTNCIIENICKPELLENLILTNVKLPSGYTLKKFTGLKIISLNQIRFSNISAFIEEIPCAKTVEGLNFFNVDFEKNSITMLKKFKNLKYLSFDNVINAKLEELNFLTSNKKLEKLKIHNSKIEIKEINNLLKGKSIKNISVELSSENEQEEIKDRLMISENAENEIMINSASLGELMNTTNIRLIDKLSIVLDKENRIEEYVKSLKKVKGIINILIKDVSYLTVDDAKMLKEELGVEWIDIIGVNNEDIQYTHMIDSYMIIRQEFDNYIKMLPKHSTLTEEFLELYRILAENLKIDDAIEEVSTNINNLENILVEKKCLSKEFAIILQNCLACLDVESYIIKGTNKYTNQEHCWNQLSLDGKWYNTDIAMDAKWISQKSILKRKSKYCLLSDRSFYESHLPISGNTHFAGEDFDKKLLKVFFKTGIYHTNLFKSYLQNVMKNVKRVFKISKLKSLPSQIEESNKNNQV